MNDATRAKFLPSRVGSFVVVVAIFAGLGPVIGGFFLWLFFAVVRVFSVGLINFEAANYFLGLIPFLLGSFFIGISYALIAGSLVAVAGVWLRWNSFIIPILAAAVANVAGTLILQFYFPYFEGAPSYPFYLVMLPVCLASTFVCWHFTRSIVRRTWPSV